MEKVGSVFRNICKGHMGKTKGGSNQGWEVGTAVVRGSIGEQMETSVLEQYFKRVKKNTMTYYFTCVRMAIINKSTKKLWPAGGEKGSLVHCLVGMQTVQPLWKTVWNFLRKLKMELHFDLANPLLGLYPRFLKHQFKRTYASQCS